MANITRVGCAARNFRKGRPAGMAIEAVVIHIIDGPQSAADSTFLDNTLSNPRSAHYSVGRDGAIHQYVDEADTAFHAGNIVNPSWTRIKKNASGGHVNPNYYTIGIEHDGRPNDEWTDEMYAASAELLRGISQRYPALATLTRQNVVMHREIRADKSCPGFKVDMNRLIAAASGGGAPGPVTPAAIVVVARGAVNVRAGKPSTAAPVARVLADAAELNVVAKVQGQQVTRSDGTVVSDWYRTSANEYVWGGAVQEKKA